MTKSTITRERTQQIFLGNGPEPSASEERELARIALAAMDSEIVAWEVKGILCHTLEEASKYVGVPEPLYADPRLESVSAEPVAYIGERVLEDMAEGYCGRVWPFNKDELSGESRIPLYRHAQPAPAVQCPYPCGWDNLNKLAIQDAALVARGLVEGEPTTEAQRQAAISNNDRLLKVISACRAAMLQAGDAVRDLSTPVDPQVAEYKQSVMQGGSSPVIPDGYVMVPKEPTAEMISSGIAAHYDRSQIQIHDRPAPGPMECAYVAMLAAAPQEVKGE